MSDLNTRVLALCEHGKTIVAKACPGPWRTKKDEEGDSESDSIVTTKAMRRTSKGTTWPAGQYLEITVDRGSAKPRGTAHFIVRSRELVIELCERVVPELLARIEKLEVPAFPIFESAGRVGFEEIRDLITGFEKERWEARGTKVVKRNEGDVETIVDLEGFRDPECDKRVAKIMAAAPRVLLTFDALHAECIASHKRETEANTKAQRVAWLESELADLKLCYEALRQKTDAYAMAHEAREKHSESSRERSSVWEGEREMLNDAVGAALKALREREGP